MTVRQKHLFASRVYWKSEQEGITVETRAAMLHKSVSTYIRDLVMIDLYNANLRQVVDTSDKVQKAKDLMRQNRNDEAAALLIGSRKPPLTAEMIAASSARLNQPEDAYYGKRDVIMEGIKTENEVPQTDLSGPISNDLPKALQPDDFKPIPIDEMEFDISDKPDPMDLENPEQHNMTLKDIEEAGEIGAEKPIMDWENQRRK